jgi:hypothetical protein
MKEDQPTVSLEQHEKDFLRNPVYIAVTSKTIKTAEKAYSFARLLSTVLFSIGVVLLIVSVLLGIFGDNTLLTVFFGGLGATNIITLFFYRPIERIQTGVDALIKSQIACVSFAAQYDIIMRSVSGSKDVDNDMRLRMAQYLQDATKQLMADLDARSLDITESRDEKTIKQRSK